MGLCSAAPIRTAVLCSVRNVPTQRGCFCPEVGALSELCPLAERPDILCRLQPVSTAPGSVGALPHPRHKPTRGEMSGKGRPHEAFFTQGLFCSFFTSCLPFFFFFFLSQRWKSKASDSPPSAHPVGYHQHPRMEVSGKSPSRRQNERRSCSPCCGALTDRGRFKS